MTDIRFADGTPPPEAGVFTRAPSSLHLQFTPAAEEPTMTARPQIENLLGRGLLGLRRERRRPHRVAVHRGRADEPAIGREGDLIGPFEGRDGDPRSCTRTPSPRRPTSAGTTCRTSDRQGGRPTTSAIATTNLTLLSIENGAIRVLSSGWYRDQLVHRDGAWLIADRYVYLDLPY